METNTVINTMGVLDIFFISVFLVANIVLGILNRNKCWDVKEVVFGKNSKFTDLTLLCTFAASICSTGAILQAIEEPFISGLSVTITCLIMFPLSFFLSAIFILPRIPNTHKTLTWYEYVGKRFDSNALRMILSLCEIIVFTGVIGMQYKVIAKFIATIFDGSIFLGNVCVVIFAISLTFYTAYGGLKTTSITDVLQFFVFIIIIFFFVGYLWSVTPFNHSNVVNLCLHGDEKFSLKNCFGDISTTIKTLSIWGIYLIPGLTQPYYQRIYACRSLARAKKMYHSGNLIYFLLLLSAVFLSLQIYTLFPNCSRNEWFINIFNNYSFNGLKGLLCIAMISLGISTADSYLNSCAVLLSNDILTFFNIEVNVQKIKYSTLAIGFFAILILLIPDSGFYIYAHLQEITICGAINALLLLGLKTSKNVLWISMIAGELTIFISHLFLNIDFYYVIGIIIEFSTLLISHVIWKKYFRSDDPNMYYNKKDSFKRLKDFEYDDDLMSYTEYKLKSGEWKEDLEEALKKQNEEEENAELQKRFHAIVKERMRSVVEEYDREKAEDEAYNRSLQEKKAQDYDRSIYKEKDATKDFYELKDLPETCAAYGIVKKAGHKMCRQDILNQYINESWQWKRNHPENLNGPNNIYNDSIPVPEKIFGIKIKPKKEGKNEDPMQNITVDDFVDLRKRFKKAVKEKMEEMGLKYVPDIEDKLELMKNEQENEQKIVKKYKELWLEEIRKEQEDEKKNKKKKE